MVRQSQQAAVDQCIRADTEIGVEAAITYARRILRVHAASGQPDAQGFQNEVILVNMQANLTAAQQVCTRTELIHGDADVNVIVFAQVGDEIADRGNAGNRVCHCIGD